MKQSRSKVIKTTRIKESLLKLSQYDAFVITEDFINAVQASKKRYLPKSDLSELYPLLPTVEPLFYTINMIVKRKWTFAKAENQITMTKNALAHQLQRTISEKYRKVLTLGLPTVIETALKGNHIEVRCIHPTLHNVEVPGFLERCKAFYRDTPGKVVHLSQCDQHVNWADAIILDTLGICFSAYVREGTGMVWHLARERKPLILAAAECQWTSARDIHGLPLGPYHFEFLVTEGGLHEYEIPEDPLGPRWNFKKTGS